MMKSIAVLLAIVADAAAPITAPRHFVRINPQPSP
jgi:hypothetical protein